MSKIFHSSKAALIRMNSC